MRFDKVIAKINGAVFCYGSFEHETGAEAYIFIAPYLHQYLTLYKR